MFLIVIFITNGTLKKQQLYNVNKTQFNLMNGGNEYDADY